MKTLAPDQADMLLLAFCALLVLAPHAAHLPPWTTAIVAAALLWRAALTLGGRRQPPRPLLLALALLAMAGVYVSFRTLLGRDAGVAMLALLLAFKLLEMQARRDVFVVLYLGFFLLLCDFFYSQSIATGLAMLVSIVFLLAAQRTFQYTGARPPLARRLRQAGATLALAAPLALLLFFGFPRIQGPLWGLPGDAHSGRSGLSDSMAPGDLSSLALSDDSAFTVRFSGPLPARSQLYWRAIVLGNYDGRTWTRLPRPRGRAEPAEPAELVLRGPALHYQVTLEATGRRWLMALEMPQRLPGIGGQAASASAEMEIAAAVPVFERVRYAATSYPAYSLQADEPAERLRPWLALPAGFNPRTLAWAATLRRADPGASVAAVLQAFRDGPFRYTLEPPLLGKNAVDDFLFVSQAGFCEHYAGAFVVLMRAMGIPARVVTGYQGGEQNPLDAALAVRQSDAHAWAEVWLAGRGWVRVDPTAAVAPERIERAPARALPAWRRGWIGADDNSLLSRLRFGVAALNHAWNDWVLDYSPARQSGLMRELDAAFGNWRSLLGAAAIAALLGVARLLRARAPARPLSAADALYRDFCRRQARRGCARAPHEGPLAYADRLAAAGVAPAQALRRFLQLYSLLKYGPAQADKMAMHLKTLKSLLTESH